MTYRCCNCGHLFEEGELAVWGEFRGECWGTVCSESMSGCPICKGDYEEAKLCKKCDSWHAEEELTNGICNSCLEDEIGYSSFLDFMLEMGALRDFLTEVVWEKMDMVGMFYFKQAEDELGKRNFLQTCKSYIMENQHEIGKEEFADWLNKRETYNGKK